MTDSYGELVTFLGGHFDRINDRFDAVDGRLTRVESRLTRVEGRLTALETEGSRLRTELRAGFDLVNRRLERLERAS